MTIRIGLGIVLLTSTFAASSPPRSQQAPPAARPNFSGPWEPADRARSTSLFDVGIGWVPGNGRIAIEQRANRLTVALSIPDEVLDPLLMIQGQFFMTVMYRIVEPRVGSGGFGAAGDVRSSWQGDRLVLRQSQSGIRQITVSLSMETDRLRKDSHTVIAEGGKESTVSEWFVRAK